MQVYLVGGAVRDGLLGLPVKDKDFVVVGASAQEMLALGFLQVGADFPVFLHPKTHHEYALARLERKNGVGYQGFATEIKNVSLEEDLLRRDLTINAMAIQVKDLFDDTPKTRQVIDPYDGMNDLKNKTLRHVSPAFSEDPLRILRTVRFLARYEHLGFKIADETIRLMQTMAKNGEILHLSRERLWTESIKAMTCGTGDSYWRALKELKILPHFLKKLDECWHDEIIFKQVIANLALAKKCNIAVQFSILCSGYLGNSYLHKQLIDSTANSLNIPKYPIQITNLLKDFYDLFDRTISAKRIIELIEQTKAHQDKTTLLDLITAITIINKKINKIKVMDLLNHIITIYKSIGIHDVDSNLQGKQIGMALAQLRQKKIQDLLNNIDNFYA